MIVTICARMTRIGANAMSDPRNRNVSPHTRSNSLLPLKSVNIKFACLKKYPCYLSGPQNSHFVNKQSFILTTTSQDQNMAGLSCMLLVQANRWIIAFYALSIHLRYLSIYYFRSISIYLSVCLSAIYLSISSICLNVRLPQGLSIFLSIYLSFLYIYLSIYISFYPSQLLCI